MFAGYYALIWAAEQIWLDMRLGAPSLYSLERCRGGGDLIWAMIINTGLFELEVSPCSTVPECGKRNTKGEWEKDCKIARTCRIDKEVDCHTTVGFLAQATEGGGGGGNSKRS